MNNSMNDQDLRILIKRLFIYLLFIIAVICSWRLIMQFETLLGWVNWLFAVASPFLQGFVMAYVLNIPYSFMRRVLSRSRFKELRKKQRMLALLFAYLAFFAAVFLILQLIVPAISQSVALFVGNIDSYYSGLQNLINYINGFGLFTIDMTVDKIWEAVQGFGMDSLPASINSSIDAFFGVSSVVLNFFLALISSLYILIEKDAFKSYARHFLDLIIPPRVCSVLLHYSAKLNNYFRQYISTQAIDGLILGTLTTIELSLVGSQFSLVLGILLGVMNFIPYFGSIIGVICAVIIVLFTQNLTAAIITAIALTITQQIDGNVIQPRLLSGSFSLSPLLIIISIMFGGAIGGPFGMLVAIPIVAILKNILDDFILYLERIK